jgi:hypothetical protein
MTDILNETPDMNIMRNRIRAWVDLSPGEFSLSDLERDLPVKKGKVNEIIDQRFERIWILEELVRSGELQRVGSRRGWYRPTNLQCPPMDFSDVDDMPVNIFWPFGIHQLVELYPGNIATIGGQKNAGKSAYLLNLAMANRDIQEVHFFSSEQGKEEMFVRLSLFQHMSMDEWSKVKFYERSGDFAEVVKPGQGKLNIIDFLECTDEFYRIGGLIRDIFDALHRAVAVIAIQQNPGTEVPIGGYRSTEKSRLHLKMAPGELTIKVGKNWARPGLNPNGMFVNYKLVNGCDFKPVPVHGSSDIWRREDNGKAD